MRFKPTKKKDGGKVVYTIPPATVTILMIIIGILALNASVIAGVILLVLAGAYAAWCIQYWWVNR